MINTSKDNFEKEPAMVNERIYVAIAIVLTGIVLATLMTVFNLPA
jgi:hypothetical protein